MRLTLNQASRRGAIGKSRVLDVSKQGQARGSRPRYLAGLDNAGVTRLVLASSDPPLPSGDPLTVSIKTLPTLCLFILAPAMLAPGKAQAQTHVCGSGPGPGEVQVGEQPGGHGVAAEPLCDWTQGPARVVPRNTLRWGDPNRPSTLPQGWSASVTNHDPDSLKAMSFSKGMPSREAAIDAAMADCRSKGTTRCDLIAAVNVP